MRLVKRLDTYIMSSFLQLFAGTFFVCLFIFMMQFTWRYLDDLIGKGLSFGVLAQFFWYTALTLIPMSLPLAILLASLITFGNLGEKLELLSMKSAGIPLYRILQPIFLFVLLISGASFYFQNKIGPEATKQLATLLWSMRQKSPELEIPEGQFYSEIPGYNLYVEKKDKETGMLYGVMIYTNTGNYEETQIVLADSARLQSTADKQHLKLTLFAGERFRNMDAKSGNMMRASVPYMRETFNQEVDLIPFDANFNIMDASLFAGNAATKDLKSVNHGIDSLLHQIDSTGRSVYDVEMHGPMARGGEKNSPTAQSVAKSTEKSKEEAVPFDTLYAHLSQSEKQAVMHSAQSRVVQLQSEYDFRSMVSKEDCHTLRLHYVERHKKFTLSIACLVFFFIGGPLGAIIRKGGLGIPVIVSVLIFIFYYIVNVSGEKMAKTGQWYIPFGVWLSTIVLAPIGAFLTVKANKDSAVFDFDGYRMFFKRLLGIRSTRKINRKDVVIQDPDYHKLIIKLTDLSSDCHAYALQHRLGSIPNYRKIFFQYHQDSIVEDISERLEAIVDEIHNCQDTRLLGMLNELPILSTTAHTRPFKNKRKNVAIGVLFPIGAFFYLRIWRYRLRLQKDMKRIQELAENIIERIKHIIDEQQSKFE